VEHNRLNNEAGNTYRNCSRKILPRYLTKVMKYQAVYTSNTWMDGSQTNLVMLQILILDLGSELLTLKKQRKTVR